MAKKRGGLYKEPNGTWRVATAAYVDGQRVTITARGFKTESEANKYKLKRVRELKKGDFNFRKKNILIEDLLVKYLDYLNGKITKSTVYRIQLLLNKHSEMIKNKTISEALDKTSLNDLMTYVNNLNVTNDYKNKIIKNFVKMFDFGYKVGVVTNDEFKNVNLFLVNIKDDNVTKQNQAPIWSRNEFTAFLNSIPTNNKYYVFFALWGQLGARIGEIRALQVKHFLEDENAIMISQQANSKLGLNRTLITPPKTRSSIRKVGITSSMVEILKMYISELELNENDFLFFGSKKDSPLSENSIRFAIKKYCAISGVKEIPTHSIRKSNATWLLTGDLSLEEIGKVSERLGHGSKTMTLNIYFQVNKKDNKNILEMLEFTTK